MCVGVCFDECMAHSSCGCRPECAPEHCQLPITDSPLARQRQALCPLRGEIVGFLTDLYTTGSMARHAPGNIKII